MTPEYFSIMFPHPFRWFVHRHGITFLCNAGDGRLYYYEGIEQAGHIMQEYQEQNTAEQDPLFDFEPDDHELAEGEFRKGEDGKYHWIYYMEMLKNRHFFWFIVKLIMGCLLGVVLLLSVISIGSDWDQYVMMLKVMVPVGIVLFLITLFSYWLVAKLYQNVYCMAYEMDEEGISFSQVSDQAEITRIMSQAMALTGAAMHSSGMIAAGLAGSAGGMTTEFSKVNSVTVDKENRFIGMRQFLFYNMIYADDPYFDFIADYIVKRCVNAKIRIR